MRTSGLGESGHIWRAGAGWIFLALLVGAPWAWGCVDDWAKMSLAVGGLLSTGLWAVSLLSERRRPAVPWPCLVAVGCLLAFGWFMAFNAQSRYSPELHGFIPIRPWLARGPGAVDGFTAREFMWPLSGILGVLLVACDLSRHAVWRRRIWWTMILTGGSVAGYGLLEKARVLPAISSHPGHPDSVFGPFQDHGNGGSYLNMVMPLAFGMVVVAFSWGWSWLWKIFCLGAWVVYGMAVFVNISRGAWAVAEVELIMLVTWVGWRSWRNRRGLRGSRRTAALIGGLCAAILVVGALAIVADRRGAGFGAYLKDGAHSGRVLAWRVAWGIGTDRPWLGAGPGSFKLLFPGHEHWIHELYSHWIITYHVPGERVSEWSYACNDYLQTWVEWGVLGMILWGVLVVGGLSCLLRRAWALPAGERVFPYMIAVGVAGVFLHALGDYPLQISSLQLYAAVMLGLGWGGSNFLDSNSAQDKRLAGL